MESGTSDGVLDSEDFFGMGESPVVGSTGRKD